MAKPDDGGAAESAAVVDAGVAIRVDQDVVVGADQAGNGAEVGEVAGREYHYELAAEKLGEPCFQFGVAGVGAVGDARAGGAGAALPDRAGGRSDAFGVECQAEVIVGAREQYIAAVDDRLGRRQDLVDPNAERVLAGADDLAVLVGDAGKLVEDIHVNATPLVVAGPLVAVESHRPDPRSFEFPTAD